MADVSMESSSVGTDAGVKKPGGTSGRVAVVCVIAAVALQGMSGLLLSAAGISADIRFDPTTLVANGASSAEYFHWASVVDLFGYLLVAPLVVYLYHRFREDPRMVLYTAAGFAYIFAGAFGAIIFLSAGPALLRAYSSAAGPERSVIATTFTTMYQVVVPGLWHTLEALPGGVWLLGVGMNLWRGSKRALAVLPFAFAVLFLALAVYRLVTF